MKKHTGFTLIEMVVYTAIFAVMTVLIINSLLIVTKSLGSIWLTRDINSSAQIALERMAREIRLADSIDQGTSVFGVNPGRLKLNTIDPETSAVGTVEFFISNNRLMITEGGITESLTGQDLEVSNLIFTSISASTISKAVKIDLEIKGQWVGGEKTEKFYDTLVLRRSY